jgi:hypothetical protein
MKVRVITPDQMVISFTRRDITIIHNCLREASHGLVMDRFLPLRKDLIQMQDEIKAITAAKDFFRFKPAIV